MDGLTVTELHTQDGWDWPNGVGDERWPVEAPSRRERANRDRVLDDLTAKVLLLRIAHPNASKHNVCTRKPGVLVNHAVPATVPAASVRAWLAFDIGWT